MQMLSGANNYLVLVVLIFVAILLLLEGAYLFWKSHKGPEATRLQRRLTTLSGTLDKTAQTQLLRQRMLSESPLMERLLQRIPRMRRFDRFLVQSGLRWTVAGVLLSSATLWLASWFVLSEIYRQRAFIVLVVSSALCTLPFLYVNYRRQRRLAWIERQLPDALDLMTRALRAGHAFSAALKMAGEETADPIASEFRAVHDEINFGVSLQQALTHLSERLPLTDLRYFVVAVLIQRDSGGNLTEILSDLSQLIRERAKLMAKIRVLSSQGKLSAWILGLMPFGIAAVTNLANPEFMSLLWTDPIGIGIIKVLLTLMVIGAILMRHIIRIRV